MSAAVLSSAGPSGHALTGSSTTLNFQAPTYAYWIDRSPDAFPLLLDYLRDGVTSLRLTLPSCTDLTLRSLISDSDYYSLPNLGMLAHAEWSRREQTRYLSVEDRFWVDVVQVIDQLFPDETGGLANGEYCVTARGTERITLDTSATMKEKESNKKGEGGNDGSGGESTGNGDGETTNNSTEPPSPTTLAPPPLTTSRRTAAAAQKNVLIGRMLRRLAFQKDDQLRVCAATYRHHPDFSERLLDILHTQCHRCSRRVYYRPIGLREGRDTGCPVHPPTGQWDRKLRMWTCCGAPEFSNSGCQPTGIHYTTWAWGD